MKKPILLWNGLFQKNDGQLNFSIHDVLSEAHWIEVL